jgi:hypothetical protein
MPKSSKMFLVFKDLNKKLYAFLVFPIQATYPTNIILFIMIIPMLCDDS